MEPAEIKIANPITFESINNLFNEMKSCNSKLLLIDFGDHDFESLQVLKELKSRFGQEKEILDRFDRIALMHPSKYNNISLDKERYDYFADRAKAIEWLKYDKSKSDIL